MMMWHPIPIVLWWWLINYYYLITPTAISQHTFEWHFTEASLAVIFCKPLLFQLPILPCYLAAQLHNFPFHFPWCFWEIIPPHLSFPFAIIPTSLQFTSKKCESCSIQQYYNTDWICTKCLVSCFSFVIQFEKPVTAEVSFESCAVISEFPARFIVRL